MKAIIQNTGRANTGSSASTIYQQHMVDQVAASLLDDETFIREIKNYAIAASTELLLASLRPNNEASDPFDSIYIADLKPDLVSTETVNRINSIRHLSDSSADIAIPEED